MLDELEFRHAAEEAMEDLKKSLYAAEEDSTFETEEQGGVLNLLFEEPPGKFVLTSNSAARQIWISALSTSFKLDWDEASRQFLLPRTREPLKTLVSRLINEHLGENSVSLE